MSTFTKPQAVVVTCTAEMGRPRVNAGAEFAVRIRAQSTPPCDFEGEVVTIRDGNGELLASAPLGEYDHAQGANVTPELRVRAPAIPGRYVWSAALDDYGDDDIVYEGASAPVAFEVSAHRSDIVVWDVPAGVTAGARFAVKVGVKCACGCNQNGREVTISDRAGTVRARATLGPEIWPKSKALHYTEVELVAPLVPGLVHLRAQCEGGNLSLAGEAIAHEVGVTEFHLRSTPAPEHRVRIQAWDADADRPLAGARVSLHPFSAIADATGMAELVVPGGDYRLFVSQTKFTTFGVPVAIAADLDQRVALHHEPPPNRE